MKRIRKKDIDIYVDNNDFENKIEFNSMHEFHYHLLLVIISSAIITLKNYRLFIGVRK